MPGTEAVPFVLPNGVKMYVEATRADGHARPPNGELATGGDQNMDGVAVNLNGGSDSARALDALPNFDSVAQSIESIASVLGESLRKVKPKKAALSFGMEIQVEAGKLTALLCKGTAKANLTVTLEWTE